MLVIGKTKAALNQKEHCKIMKEIRQSHPLSWVSHCAPMMDFFVVS